MLSVGMKVQDFGFMMQLVVVSGCIMWRNGIITSLVSTAPWFFAHFDQIVVITDRCTTDAAFEGNRF